MVALVTGFIMTGIPLCIVTFTVSIIIAVSYFEPQGLHVVPRNVDSDVLTLLFIGLISSALGAIIFY